MEQKILMRTQKVIIMEGPDGCGKTEIGKELAKQMGIPYFKVSSEHENWKKGKFKEALRFDQTYISDFLKQTGYSCVIDRAWPSEYVYSDIFKRETDIHTLCEVDSAFSNINATVVLCMRNSYYEVKDELVPNEKLEEIHKKYLTFVDWTLCDVIVVPVDGIYNNDLNIQIPALKKALEYTFDKGTDFKVTVNL